MTQADALRLDEVVAPLARGLAARLRDAAEAADRLADFSFDARPGRPSLPTLADGDEAPTAHDFVLRVLLAAGEPLNFAVLDAACAPDGATLTDMAGDLGLTRLALVERVHGLIQLGLIARDLQADTARTTAAGSALVELVSGLESEVAQWLAKRRRR
jgi:hypothetical protein